MQCLWTIYKKQRKNTKKKNIGDSRYFYQNELDKICFQHDMAYGDFKYLKYFVIKHLILLKIQNMMDIKEVFLQRFINSLIKKLLVAVLKMRICETSN